MVNKRDLSISLARANVIVWFISIPVAVLQFLTFSMLHGAENLRTTWNFVVRVIAVLLGVVVHELIHGISWMIFGTNHFLRSHSASSGKPSRHMRT